MRRVAAGALLVAALVSGWAFWARADDVRTGLIVCTATRSHIFVANPNRIGGFIQNVGTLHVSVGRRVGTGNFIGVTLHVGSVLELTPGYTGGMECQTSGGAGSTEVEWYEESR